MGRGKMYGGRQPGSTSPCCFAFFVASAAESGEKQKPEVSTQGRKNAERVSESQSSAGLPSL